MHVAIQFFQHHLQKRMSFLKRIILNTSNLLVTHVEIWNCYMVCICYYNKGLGDWMQIKYITWITFNFYLTTSNFILLEFWEKCLMTGLLSMMFDIQMNLIPLLFWYVCNLHHNDTMITVSSFTLLEVQVLKWFL